MPLVLMYHSVAEYRDDPFLITVRPRRFERQLRWMRRAGLRGVGVGELLAQRDAGRGRGLVGLTFDDGYADFATTVAPLLRRFGFGATVFVLAGRLGGDNGWEAYGPRKRLMTAEQVRRIAESGLEIGSHGLAHRHLSTVDPAALAAEAGSSRSILQELTGARIAGFCYPYGDLSATVVAAVRAAGYDYACAVTRTPRAGRFAIPRTYVGDRDHGARLAAKWLRHRMAAPVGTGKAVERSAR